MTGAQAAQPEPSELESHLGFWLRFVSNHVSARFAGLAEQMGISVSEWVALRYLYDKEAGNAGELVDALGMTKGAISKVLGRLEAKGLLERVAGAADRRAQLLRLTAAGRELVPTVAQLADENDALFFSHLDADARRQLMSLLRQTVRVHGLRAFPVE